MKHALKDCKQNLILQSKPHCSTFLNQMLKMGLWLPSSASIQLIKDLPRFGVPTYPRRATIVDNLLCNLCTACVRLSQVRTTNVCSERCPFCARSDRPLCSSPVSTCIQQTNYLDRNRTEKLENIRKSLQNESSCQKVLEEKGSKKHVCVFSELKNAKK